MFHSPHKDLFWPVRFLNNWMSGLRSKGSGVQFLVSTIRPQGLGICCFQRYDWNIVKATKCPQNNQTQSFEQYWKSKHKRTFSSIPVQGLLERLQSGESLVVAEGYLFEFERRGYLKAGTFVPEVVLEYPELVRALHEEYVHAGSDVVLAFTVRHNSSLQFALIYQVTYFIS